MTREHRTSLQGVPLDTLFDGQGYLLDSDGKIVYGYVRVTHPTLPLVATETEPERHCVHGAEGLPILSFAYSGAINGSVTPWKVQDLLLSRPNDAARILEAIYINNGSLVRCKVVQLPNGVTPIETNLVPHLWAGE